MTRYLLLLAALAAGACSSVRLGGSVPPSPGAPSSAGSGPSRASRSGGLQEAPPPAEVSKSSFTAPTTMPDQP